jgi:hypothetical protein
MKKMMKTLNNTLSKVLGWDADYYFTEKTENFISIKGSFEKPTFEEHETYNIKDMINIKVLIPEQPKVKVPVIIHVPKDEFKDKKPNMYDIIYLKNRLYYVKKVMTTRCIKAGFDEDESNYALELEKYEQFSVKK